MPLLATNDHFFTDQHEHWLSVQPPLGLLPIVTVTDPAPSKLCLLKQSHTKPSSNMPKTEQNAPESGPDARLVRLCLERMLGAEEFDGAKRLQALLKYIVEEALAGRGDRLRGKTIAADVYGRKITDAPDGEPVVRVDASRLRRRLRQYYNSDGQNDAIKIEIPAGSYVPTFTAKPTPEKPPNIGLYQRHKRHAPLALVCLVAIGLGSIVVVQYDAINDLRRIGPVPATAGPSKVELERQAMFNKSPSSLQAYDFAQQAREMIFPPIDPVGRQSALDLAKRSIAFDGDYFGGYAAAAQILAFSVVVPGPDDKSRLLADAKAMADNAQNLNPNSAWVQSSIAWVSFVSGEFDKAVRISDLAIAMDPLDPHVRDIHGMIALFNGDFERALAIVAEQDVDGLALSRLVHRNIKAVASFHLGNIDDAIELIDDITKFGGASSLLTSCYLAAAHQVNGDHRKASDLVERIDESWPNAPFGALLRRVFRNPEHSENVLKHLRDAGWNDQRLDQG